MSDTIIATSAADPTRVTARAFTDGKFSFEVDQPLNLGPGVDPLTARQAWVVSQRIAHLISRLNSNLSIKGW